jgi:hypothetical protein
LHDLEVSLVLQKTLLALADLQISQEVPRPGPLFRERITLQIFLSPIILLFFFRVACHQLSFLKKDQLDVQGTLPRLPPRKVSPAIADVCCTTHYTACQEYSAVLSQLRDNFERGVAARLSHHALADDKAEQRNGRPLLPRLVRLANKFGLPDKEKRALNFIIVQAVGTVVPFFIDIMFTWYIDNF